MSKLFTIITATRNSFSLLEDTAASLSAQSFKHFEWIIVDSSSDLQSRLISTSVAKKHSALLFCDIDNSLANAWNIGIRCASAPYILFLNAGDTYSSSFLDLCSQNVNSDLILLGQPNVVSESKVPLYLFRAEPHKLWRGMHVAHNWMCVHREFFLFDGFFKPLPYAMDYEWLIRLITSRQPSFQVLPLVDGPHGNYLLGGLSDKNYIQSLILSLRISLHYSLMNRLTAIILFFLYLFSRIIKRSFL